MPVRGDALPARQRLEPILGRMPVYDRRHAPPFNCPGPDAHAGARVLRRLGFEDVVHRDVPGADGVVRSKLRRGSATPLWTEARSQCGARAFARPIRAIRSLDRQGELPREGVLRGEVPGRVLCRCPPAPGAGQGLRRAVPEQGSLRILLRLRLRAGLPLLRCLAPAALEDAATLLERLLGPAQGAPSVRQWHQPRRGGSALPRGRLIPARTSAGGGSPDGGASDRPGAAPSPHI
jgi:hypothetical protein